MKLLTFLLFLCAYAAWLTLSYLLTEIFSRPRTRGAKLFWVTEGTIVLTIVGFFALIYLLSGLWSLQLVVMFLAAAQLGVALGAFLNAVLGSSSEKSRSRIRAAGGEIGLRYPKVTVSMFILSGLILAGYVVMGAIIHFRYPWNSQVLHVAAVKYTLIGVIFVPNIPVWAEMAALLAAEELDETTRQQVLINQLAGMVLNALFISLALWAFGVGAGDLPATLATVVQTFSTRVTILVLAFPMVMFMLPYWIGTQRGSHYRLQLVRKRRELTSKLADILETPLGAKYVPEITALQTQVTTELSNTLDSSPVMTFHSANPVQAPASFDAIKFFVADSMDLDPRFQHADELVKFDGELKEINADLQAKTQIGVIRTAERWSRKYEIRKADLAGALDTTHAAKPVVLLAVGTILSALISSILSDVGKTAWAAIAGGTMHK